VRVPRSAIGRFVALTWLDPLGFMRAPIDSAPKGNEGLAKWTEHGVIDDLTDGVVRIIHSRGHAPTDHDRVDEISGSLVPEDRVVDIKYLVPEVQA
jgi:hypothetical protein